MTEATVAGMYPGEDLALWCRRTGTAGCMTGLARSDPAQRAVILGMAGGDGLIFDPVAADIKSIWIARGHIQVRHRTRRDD